MITLHKENGFLKLENIQVDPNQYGFMLMLIFGISEIKPVHKKIVQVHYKTPLMFKCIIVTPNKQCYSLLVKYSFILGSQNVDFLATWVYSLTITVAFYLIQPNQVSCSRTV